MHVTCLSCLLVVQINIEHASSWKIKGLDPDDCYRRENCTAPLVLAYS
jgi:hypothetical protein